MALDPALLPTASGAWVRRCSWAKADARQPPLEGPLLQECKGMSQKMACFLDYDEVWWLLPVQAGLWELCSPPGGCVWGSAKGA